MTTRTFSDLQQDPLSTLQYRLSPATGPMRGRLLLLHGVGSNERGMVALGEHMPADLEVLAVQGPLAIGPQAYAWFNVQFGAQGPVIDAGQADASRRQLMALIESLASAPTVIAGFSQGGIMSAGVGLTAPQLVKGFGLLSGRILPEIAEHVAGPGALSNLKAFVAHGIHDNKLPVSWAEKADQWLNELGVRHELKLYPIGHELSGAVVADFVEWLDALIPA